MKKHLFIIGCALAAFADRLCGRGLAVNEAPAAAISGTLPSNTPVVTVGIPTNLDQEKVRARKAALIAAGTEPLLAEKLAVDAEQQQYLRDHHLSLETTVEERPATETIIKIKATPDGTAEDVDLGAMTVPQLEALAARQNYDLKGATKKADIIAAISSAAKATIVALCCALFFGASSPAVAAAPTSFVVASAVSADLEDAPATQLGAAERLAIATAPEPFTLLASAQPAEEQWALIICAAGLAIGACAWLPKRYRKAERRLGRGWFRMAMFFALIAHRLRGRALAINMPVFTPQETSHGTASLLSDVVVSLTNAAVVRGSDDRHFKLSTASTDVPLGVLQRDNVDSGEQNVTPKALALFGLYPESIPAVAGAAIAVDAELALEVATGRVITLPTTTGTFYSIGRSRFAVAAANDPVSIAHQVPRKVVNP